MLLTRPNLIRQAAAGALVLASSRRASAQQPPLAIRYGSTPTASGVPAYWAAQNGMFREAGLDVTVTKGGNSSTITAALSAGALDIGETTAIPLVNAHIHGLDIVAFCSNFIYVAGRPAFNALVVSTNSPYRTPKDLNGQTVSCAAVRDTAWLVTRAFLDAGGGDSASVKFVEIPYPAVVAALQDNRIQGGTIVDPFLSSGIKAGTIRSTGDLLGSVAPRIIQTAYAVRRDYLVQNRAALTRFARVIRTANEYMNTHRSEFATLTEAYTGIPVAAQTPEATLFATATDARDFQPWYDMAFKYGTLPSRVRADEVVSRLI